MRFFCDQDVDVRVAVVLRALGHNVWTASDAGLAKEADDALTVYSHDQNAVLITHDAEFSRRRRRNVVGRHIFLRCKEWDAPDVIAQHLDAVLPVLERRADVWVRLSMGIDPEFAYGWE